MSIRKRALQFSIDQLELDGIVYNNRHEEFLEVSAEQRAKIKALEANVKRLYDFLNTVIDRVNIQKLAIEELSARVEAAVGEGDVAYDNVMDEIAELRRYAISPSKLDTLFADIFNKAPKTAKPAPATPATDLELALRAGKEWQKSNEPHPVPTQSPPSSAAPKSSEPYAEQGPYKTTPKGEL